MTIRSAHDLFVAIESSLWRDTEKMLPKWQQSGLRGLQIAFAVLRNIAEGHLNLRAMSLVYFTIIAIVPMLALTFSVLQGLGVHNAMAPALLGLLLPFMGEYSFQITSSIVSFIENVRVDALSAVSLGVLLYSVLAMIIPALFMSLAFAMESTNAIIDAAFFAIILLMLFLYLGWLMMLIGSSVSFYHQYPDKTRSGGKPLALSLQRQEEVGLSLAYLIVKRFIQRENPCSLDQLQSYTRLSMPVLERTTDTPISVGLLRAALNDVRVLLRQHSWHAWDMRALIPKGLQIQQLMHDSDSHWAESSASTSFRKLLEQEQTTKQMSRFFI